MNETKKKLKLIRSLVCILSAYYYAVGQEIHNLKPTHNDSLSIKTTLLESAPIIMESDSFFYLYISRGDYPSKLRAVDINRRLAGFKENYKKLLDSFAIVPLNNYVELKLNNNVLMIVTASDASF